jgi:hypothetical protein
VAVTVLTRGVHSRQDRLDVLSMRVETVVTPDEELRQTSDALLTSLDRLAALEAVKRRLMPDDPRLMEVATEVHDLAAEILASAARQSGLAETAHVMAMTDEPDAPTEPIAAGHRELHDILDDWRAAERTLAHAPAGSDEAAEAIVRARDLRLEYRHAFDARRQQEKS